MKNNHLSRGLLILLGSIGSLSMLDWDMSIDTANANPPIIKPIDKGSPIKEHLPNDAQVAPDNPSIIRKFKVKPNFDRSKLEKAILAPSTPSMAELGINLGGAYYQASGNQLINWNNQNRGPHPFECVEFAYGRAIERGLFQNGKDIGSVLNGDAHTWDEKVTNSNYRDRLNTQIRENSIVVWEANQNFTWTEGNGTFTETTDPVGGHVAFVEKVYPDGSFVISEGNQKPEPVIRIIKAGTPPATAAKFIYL